MQMAPDGNCFFRSVADQLEGDAGNHASVRQKVVDHMEANSNDYAPFVENDDTFDVYATRMRKVRTAKASFKAFIVHYHDVPGSCFPATLCHRQVLCALHSMPC
jgi:OTU-like cysteine protease